MDPRPDRAAKAPAARNPSDSGTFERVAAPLVVVVAVALVHVWLAGHMRAPIVEADEFGYLYGAHFLALGGPRPATAACTVVCGAGSYYPGYSLLLMPLWWASQVTATVYHGALAINTGLAAISAWLAYVLAGRLAPAVRPSYRATVALVVAAYPSYLLFGNIVESENLLIPAYLATCILAHRAFAKRSAGLPAAPTWAGLGLVGGTVYMVHPSALAITVAVALVGGWVALSQGAHAWSRRRSIATLGALTGGLVAGLAVSELVIGYVTRGGSSNSGGLVAALGHELNAHGLAHLGVNTAGQLVYLLAVTAGLVVLAAPSLARAVLGLARPRRADHGARLPGSRAPDARSKGSQPLGDAARRSTLALIAVTSLVMGATSVVGLGTSGAGRLDITLYGRYNEAVLAPVLVAGALAGVDLARRRARGPARGHARPSRPSHAVGWTVLGGLAALGITAGAVAAARGGVLHGTPQATNILAAGAQLQSGTHPSISLLPLAGYGAGVLVLVALAFGFSNLLLAATIAVSSFIPSTAAGLGDLAAQSRSAAGEGVIPSTLVSLRTGFGATATCVGFDTTSPSPQAGFSYFNYRLYDPTQSFAPFSSAGGGRPCSEEVVSSVADLSASLPGAREVVQGNGTGLALWVLPGALADRLAAAGRLRLPTG